VNHKLIPCPLPPNSAESACFRNRSFHADVTMSIFRMTLALLAFGLTFLLLAAQEEAPAQQDVPVSEEAPARQELSTRESSVAESELDIGQKPFTLQSADTARSNGPVDVYVIPITEAIAKPNLFILRRGLKEAIEQDIDMVLLEMDTPGGRVDITIEMMEMLARFEGITATFVNDEAISAGSFITAATQEIYFSPTGKIGASAVIMGGGQEVPETARLKIESYLRASIRAITAQYPYRSDVVRAMLDPDFELVVEGEVIKPAGELLTLTANEALKEYGNPRRRCSG